MPPLRSVKARANIAIKIINTVECIRENGCKPVRTCCFV